MKIMYQVISGSHSYGLATEHSDIDTRGIFIPDEDYVYGIKRMDQKISDSEDTVLYDIRKYILLLVDSNPNILELLFVDESNIQIMDEFGLLLRNNREHFLSKRVYYTFGAYAYAQLKRMNAHVHWIKNPPKPVSPEDFSATFENGAYRFPNTNVERNYEAALKNYSNYISWKKNRNIVRAQLEEKYDYDTKHAMHTFRLLRMGQEILTTNNLTVKRPDAQFLMDIRNGLFSYDEIMNMATQETENLSIALAQSSLNERADFNFANKLCVDIMKGYYEKK